MPFLGEGSPFSFVVENKKLILLKYCAAQNMETPCSTLVSHTNPRQANI